MRLTFALALLLLSQSIWCQSDPSTHRIAGEVKTSDGAVIPGLSLSVEKDGKPLERNGYGVGAFSDINGRFTFELPAGNYKITAVGIPENRFRLFLTIADKGPIPDRLEIPIDAAAELCSSERLSPSIMKSTIPRYPPAARATRTVGAVSVDIKIRPDGSVSSATAISGHPLLRYASATAGREFTYEPSNEDGERTSTIQFVFMDSEVEDKNVKRFGCTDRILVVSEPVIIDTTTSH